MGGREDGGPILEGGVRHSSALTKGDQICDGVSIGMIDMSFLEQRAITFAFLGEQEVGLCGSRKVRHAVASVQKHRTLSIWQRGVRLYFQGFVVSEVARGRP